MVKMKTFDKHGGNENCSGKGLSVKKVEIMELEIFHVKINEDDANEVGDD